MPSKNVVLILGCLASVLTAVSTVIVLPISWQAKVAAICAACGAAITGYLAKSPLNHTDTSETVNPNNLKG